MKEYLDLNLLSKKLQDEPDNQLSVLADFVKDASYHLLEEEDGFKFLLGLTTKVIGEDYLKNTIEDDVVDHKLLKESLCNLGAYIEKRIEDGDPSGIMRKMGETYRSLMESKEKPLMRRIGDLTYYLNEDEKVDFILKNVGDFYPYFLDLDEILCEPEQSSKIISSFTGLVAKNAKKHDLDKLYFVEKRKGPLGALLMMSSVLKETNLPSFIYRTSYMDETSRVKGIPPFPDDKLGLVYDAVNTGGGIIEVVDRIRDSYHADTKFCAVLFDHMNKKDGRTAREMLKDMYDIDLVSLYNNEMVQKDVEDPKYQSFLDRRRRIIELRESYASGQLARDQLIDKARKVISAAG